MPGGRCCAASTYVDFICEKTSGTATIKDLYIMFESGKKLKVKSMSNNVVSFEDVKKIWYSGEKLTYKVCSENHCLRLTEEHLVYMPEEGIYRPVKDLLKGNLIYVLNQNKFDKHALISDPIQYETEEVYDIEIPTTKNFIGNNIVSHNSRFFRYLYKSGSGG
jgi:intein/homing endonuclease